MSIEKRAIQSLGVRWSDLTNHLSEGVRQYIVLARRDQSNLPAGDIVPPNMTSLEIGVLYGYEKYNVTVVAINNNGIPFKSRVLLAMTDGGSELDFKIFFLTDSNSF